VDKTRRVSLLFRARRPLTIFRIKPEIQTKSMIAFENIRIDSNSPPLVVPEVGINHNGDPNLAMRMAQIAKECGAQIIKFQSHQVHNEMIPTDMKPGKISDESLWDIIESSSLSNEEERGVFQYCRDLGISYLSTPFSREAADHLNAMGVSAFKIGSGETTNIPLIKHILGFRKPILLSTGMTTIEELDRTVAVLEQSNVPFILLHCVSMYPAPFEALDLRTIPFLKERYNVPVGFSDHSPGITAALAAVALGACVIEKHFTIDRKLPGADQAMSIEPNELKELIKGVQSVYQSLGTPKTRIRPEEVPVMEFARESVVAIRPIAKGESLSLANLWVKRPGTGAIPSWALESVLGKRSNRAISVNDMLTYQDFE